MTRFYSERGSGRTTRALKSFKNGGIYVVHSAEMARECDVICEKNRVRGVVFLTLISLKVADLNPDTDAVKIEMDHHSRWLSSEMMPYQSEIIFQNLNRLDRNCRINFLNSETPFERLRRKLIEFRAAVGREVFGL